MRPQATPGWRGRAFRALTDDGDWWRDAARAEALREPLLRLCADYLTQPNEGAGGIDPVARFHLGNGARLERINWLGNASPRGMKEAFGIMVNYLVRPRRHRSEPRGVRARRHSGALRAGRWAAVAAGAATGTAAFEAPTSPHQEQLTHSQHSKGPSAKALGMTLSPEFDMEETMTNPHRPVEGPPGVRPDARAGGADLRADAGRSRRRRDQDRAARRRRRHPRLRAALSCRARKESAYFVGVNRNKRSVTLDIAKPEGQAIALRLIAQMRHPGGELQGRRAGEVRAGLRAAAREISRG